MCSVQLVSVFLFILVSLSNLTNGYRVLGILTTTSKSHFIIGEALMENLVARGNEVTVISPYAMANKKYRSIEVKPLLPAFSELENGGFFHMHNMSLPESFYFLYRVGMLTTNITLKYPAVKQLIASKDKYDIIIMDLFLNEAMAGFSEVFDAPLVILGLFGANYWNTELVGSPSPPSYIPHPFLSFTDHMTLFERLCSFLSSAFEKVFMDMVFMKDQEKLFRESFPKSKKGLNKILKSTSLVLLNQHFSLSFPRPYVPNMVEVGGLHINYTRKPLSADIQKFIDEAKHGVIYFSLGSNAQSKFLPAEKRDVILRTFKSLKQRVLWKFEDPILPGKSDNIFISNWFNQDDILAHPNVKLFITHGGLLSIFESLYHAKPFLGIPIFGDQFFNMAYAEANGFGLSLKYNILNEDNFKVAIREMLENPKYTTLIRKAADRFHDQPLKPMELALYWIDYVVRHKGAPHMRCASQDLNFIQYHNIDVLAIIFGAIFLITYSLTKLVKTVLLKLFGIAKGKVKTN